MIISKIKLKFPNYVPVDNIPAGAKEEAIGVYRICKWGKIERKAFFSNYEERLFLGVALKEFDPNDVAYHSVSTYEKSKDAMKKLRLFTRHEPAAILAFGETCPDCGISQRSRERGMKKDSHVDWWVFEDAEPQNHFKEVGDEHPNSIL